MSSRGSGGHPRPRGAGAGDQAAAGGPAPRPVDSHLHLGDQRRLPDLVRYVALLNLERVGCLSLPLAGAEAAIPAAGTPAAVAGSDGTGGPARGASGQAVPGGRSAPAPVSRLINFNPEVLLAMQALPGIVDGFGSFDNRALVAGGAGAHGASGAADVRAGAQTPAAAPDADTPAEWAPAAQVAEMAAAGFAGIKMWEGKPDYQAALGITLDDPRLLKAYAEAARHKMPVLIHVADPRLFWERAGGPWSYVGRKVPSFETLIAQAEAVCRQAPGTTFIFPHLLFLADDTPRMARFLEEHENAHLDLAPGNYLYPALGPALVEDLNLSSAGASPLELATARRLRDRAAEFFERYARRILLGTDAFFLPNDLALLPGTPLADNLDRYLRLDRFLATGERFASPYAPTADDTPLIEGLDLSDEAVAAMRRENYLRLMGAPRRPDRSAALRYLERWGSGNPEAEGRTATIARLLDTGVAGGADGPSGAAPAERNPDT